MGRSPVGGRPKVSVVTTEARKVQRIYLTLLSLNTLAASFIWGINTLFLLDAGLTNTEAFAANAFFTVGMVLFEVPTGVVADLRGRRTSYLLGVVTLSFSTLLYLFMWEVSAPFWGWAIASVMLGLGFTFFSGAVEAWLVDALTDAGYNGELEAVFGKGQVVQGGAMLVGAVGGGLIAQVSNLGVPYMVRAGVLVVTFVVAFIWMRDRGFTPARGKNPIREMKVILSDSLTYGLGNPPVRWVMLAAPFTAGISFYGFYAAQPYLLELYGDTEAYLIAGLAAAVFAGAQISGGLLISRIGHMFPTRTSVLLTGVSISTLALVVIGFVQSFWLVMAMLVVWSLVFAAMTPVRQAYVNVLIPSQRRATVLSFDSLLGSTGGVVLQPALGRVADATSYGTSFVVSGALQACALPLIALAARENASSDQVETDPTRTAQNES
jgi:MFS family permease